MTIDAWLAAAVADAERRGLPELKPLLESIAASTRALRSADWCDRADGRTSDSGREDMDAALRQAQGDPEQGRRVGRRTPDLGHDGGSR